MYYIDHNGIFDNVYCTEPIDKLNMYISSKHNCNWALLLLSQSCCFDQTVRVSDFFCISAEKKDIFVLILKRPCQHLSVRLKTFFSIDPVLCKFCVHNIK